MSAGLKLLGPWRRAFQWGTTLALLLIPFIRVGGQSLLRVDIPSLTLHAFGQNFRIDELYLFLLLGLALVLFFLLVTLALGRAWCGWACPQTTLTDLAEGFARLIGVRVSAGEMTPRAWQKFLLHLFYGALSLLVAANLVWYFISPYDFFPRLFSGNLGIGAMLTLAVVAITVYLDLALLRRVLCKEFCPYGRFQTVLVDPGTLTLRFHPDEADRCIGCSACVKVCPTGIDIRRGYQVECINCGRCLDACRQAMAREYQTGIIRYTFGTEGKGLKALLNMRMLLVATVMTILATALIYGVAGRPEASLKLRAGAVASRTLEDGRQVTFFTGYLTNRLRHAQVLSLKASMEAGEPLEIRGPASDIPLKGGAKERVSFALVSPTPSPQVPLNVVFTLVNAHGKTLALEPAFVTAVKD